MGRKLRLSVHRKNEFRKKRTKQRGHVVSVSRLYPISIPLQQVALSKPSGSIHEPNNIEFKVSISRIICEQAPASTLNDLAKRQSILPILPKGKMYLQYTFIHIHVYSH